MIHEYMALACWHAVGEGKGRRTQCSLKGSILPSHDPKYNIYLFLDMGCLIHKG